MGLSVEIAPGVTHFPLSGAVPHTDYENAEDDIAAKYEKKRCDEI